VGFTSSGPSQHESHLPMTEVGKGKASSTGTVIA
jgi:hypothetical protein